MQARCMLARGALQRRGRHLRADVLISALNALSPYTQSLASLPNVYGTQLLARDSRDVYRQRLARITLDSMVQLEGLLDAQGTVLEINKGSGTPWIDFANALQRMVA
jgi:hypothetical protein